MSGTITIEQLPKISQTHFQTPLEAGYFLIEVELQHKSASTEKELQWTPHEQQIYTQAQHKSDYDTLTQDQINTRQAFESYLLSDA